MLEFDAAGQPLLIEKRKLLKSPLEIFWIEATYDDISYANTANIFWEKLLGIRKN
jgi:hypothetical protein